jgi:hypothetical protein
MRRVWDFLIGAFLAAEWSYWIGTQCFVDAVWKIWVITFVSGAGVMVMTVEFLAAAKTAQQRRQALADMARELREKDE